MCPHQFVKITDVDKSFPADPRVAEAGTAPVRRAMPGAEAGCVICGEVRRVWSNGTLDIIYAGKE